MPDQKELTQPGFLVATLASALLGQHGSGSANSEAIVQGILEAHKYVLTPDYKMKMLHIEVNFNTLAECASCCLSVFGMTSWSTVSWSAHALMFVTACTNDCPEFDNPLDQSAT